MGSPAAGGHRDKGSSICKGTQPGPQRPRQMELTPVTCGAGPPPSPGPTCGRAPHSSWDAQSWAGGGPSGSSAQLSPSTSLGGDVGMAWGLPIPNQSSHPTPAALGSAQGGKPDPKGTWGAGIGSSAQFNPTRGLIQHWRLSKIVVA